MSWLKDQFNKVNDWVTSQTGFDIGENAGSLIKQFTGSGLTGAAKEANAWTAQREDTQYQRAVTDMQQAGLNPALMYGGSSGLGSTSGSVSPSAPSDPIAAVSSLMMMKSQKNQIDAQTENTREDTKLKMAKTRAQEIANAFAPTMNSKTIEQMEAIIKERLSGASLKDQQKITEEIKGRLTEAQETAQKLTNDVLSEKLRAEIDELKARKDKTLSEKDLVVVDKAIAEFKKKFMEDHNMEVGTMDAKTAIAFAIADWLGIDYKDAFQKIGDFFKDSKGKSIFPDKTEEKNARTGKGGKAFHHREPSYNSAFNNPLGYWKFGYDVSRSSGAGSR